METTSTAGIRDINLTRKDYEAYVDCLMKTDYSNEIGKRSQNDNDPFHFTFDKFCQKIERQREAKQGTLDFTIVYQNKKGKVVAVAVLKKEGKSLKIKEFIVNRRFQLSGYGSRFYHEIEKRAKKKGYKEIRLNCYFLGAKMFWLKMGFANRGIFVKQL